VSDFSHNGKTYAGENIQKYGAIISADAIHQGWYNSQGHHDNYMYASWASGACAVYYYNGVTYAVEEFSYPATTSTSSNPSYSTIEEATQAEQTKGTPYTASNGVTVYIQPDGSVIGNGNDQATSDACVEALMNN
jgi:hypothetical protein